MRLFAFVRSARLLSLLWAASFGFLAGPGAAASLGVVQGQTVLGQTLDVRVLVEHVGEGSPDASCARAVFWQGELVSAPVALDINLEPASADRSWLRVRSRATVSDVFATLQLDWLCGSALSRRYTLLSEPAPVLGPRGATQGPQVPSTGPRTEASPVAADPPPLGRITPQAVPSRHSVERAGSDGARPTAKPKPTLASADSRGAKSVLRLVPMGDWLSQPLRLQLSPELMISEASPNAPHPSGGASAASLTWSELRLAHLSSSDELAERLRIGSSAAVGAADEQRRLRASADGLRAELAEARADRYANPLVYGLVLLLALALAWGMRMRQKASSTAAAAWWESRLPEPGAAPGDEVGSVRAPVASATRGGVEVAKRSGAQVSDLSMDGLSVHTDLSHSEFLGAAHGAVAGEGAGTESKRGGVGVDLDFTALEADAQASQSGRAADGPADDGSMERTVALYRDGAVRQSDHPGGAAGSPRAPESGQTDTSAVRASAERPGLVLDFELQPVSAPPEHSVSDLSLTPAAEPTVPRTTGTAPESHAGQEQVKSPAANGAKTADDLQFSQSDFDAFDKALSALSERSGKRPSRR